MVDEGFGVLLFGVRRTLRVQRRRLPRADAGGVAMLGIAPSRLFLWFVYPFHVSGYDQMYILTYQV